MAASENTTRPEHRSWHRPLLDRPRKWLARHPVEDMQKPILRTPEPPHPPPCRRVSLSCQLRSLGHSPICHDARSGSAIETHRSAHPAPTSSRHTGCCPAGRPHTTHTCSRSRRQIHDAALRINGELAPYIYAAHVLISVLGQARRAAESCGRPRPACLSAGPPRECLPEVQGILRSSSRCQESAGSQMSRLMRFPRGARALSIPIDRFSRPFSPKLSVDLPVLRIDGIKISASRHQNAAVLAVRTLPVVHAPLSGNANPPAVGSAGPEFVRPQLLPCRRIQRHQGASLRRNICHVIDYKRVYRECPIARREGPRHVQLAHVCRRNLHQRRIVRAVWPAQSIHPDAAFCCALTLSTPRPPPPASLFLDCIFVSLRCATVSATQL